MKKVEKGRDAPTLPRLDGVFDDRTGYSKGNGRVRSLYNALHLPHSIRGAPIPESEDKTCGEFLAGRELKKEICLV